MTVDRRPPPRWIDATGDAGALRPAHHALDALVKSLRAPLDLKAPPRVLVRRVESAK